MARRRHKHKVRAKNQASRPSPPGRGDLWTGVAGVVVGAFFMFAISRSLGYTLVGGLAGLFCAAGINRLALYFGLDGPPTNGNPPGTDCDYLAGYGGNTGGGSGQGGSGGGGGGGAG